MSRAVRAYAAEVVAELAVLKKVATPLLSDFGVPEGKAHDPHREDVCIALSRAAPGIAAECHMLIELGEASAANDTVRAGLEALREVDEFIFLPAPSPRLLALLTAKVTGQQDWQSLVTSAEYAETGARRRSAHALRLRLRAAGKPIPDESEAARMPHRDPFHHGAGAGRDNGARPARSNVRGDADPRRDIRL